MCMRAVRRADEVVSCEAVDSGLYTTEQHYWYKWKSLLRIMYRGDGTL